MNAGEVIYINVGEKGVDQKQIFINNDYSTRILNLGGYNGGSFGSNEGPWNKIGSGGGGSGYIGNTLLTNKVMYCYNCQESNDVSTKTISTTNVSETSTSSYAKKVMDMLE